jgi:hypothetical protein
MWATAGLALAAPPLLTDVAGAAGNAPAAKSQAAAVRFNAGEMFRLAPRAEVEVTLGHRAYVVIFDRAEQHGDGIASWIGYVKEAGKDYRAVITTGPAGSFGFIRTPQGEFRLVPGHGHDWLVDMTQERAFVPEIDLRDDIAIPPPTPAGTFTSAPKIVPATSPQPESTPTPQVFVDLMILYTQGLANDLGAGLTTRLNNLVVSANQAYIDSEVAITLRLVKAVLVNYTDGGPDETALNAITPPQPGFDAADFGTIETQRTAAGADLVSLLRDGSAFGGSGIAWISSTSPNAQYLYSVVTGCVLGCDSILIHEMGHNMGDAHDRATASFQAGGTASPPAGAYFYSFGYFYCAAGLTCDPTLPPGSGGCASQPVCATNVSDNFGTIMSYFNPTVLKFSNPNITCTPSGGASRPCGVSEISDPSHSADNAQSMNNMRTVISGIKAATITNLPGSLQFTSNLFTAAEGTPNLNFTVSRVGGSGGAVSVSYATSNGNALAGLDYTQSSGSLNWANGDTANKTIQVPLLSDGLADGNESFTVSLSNPSGATGVFLGWPTMATGIITEDWPPGGTMPSGFSASAGSSTSWSVATDRTYEGANSLRSGAVANLAANGYSAVQFTGTFQAGLVGFAYQVDSYPGYGPFAFIVDGTTVFTDSGNSGWKFFSYNIAAGTHTLRWQQTNVLGFACANTFPQPPQGAACADRAWIDALTLPLVTSVRIAETLAYYPSIQSAYQFAANGNTIQVRALDFPETLVFNRPISVTLKGGYDSSFASNSGSSSVTGSLSVNNGTVRVENIVLH